MIRPHLSAIPAGHPLAPSRPAVTVRRRVRPRPTVDLPRLTRYRGGTYSATVDTVTFVDGSTARTDLIRLNPGVDAYSLDFTGESPTRPSHYRMDTWSAVPNLRAHAFEAEVDWILRNSFPRLTAAELSRRLRAAGYPLGAANISEHEAIAGTQAAPNVVKLARRGRPACTPQPPLTSIFPHRCPLEDRRAGFFSPGQSKPGRCTRTNR